MVCLVWRGRREKARLLVALGGCFEHLLAGRMQTGKERQIGRIVDIVNNAFSFWSCGCVIKFCLPLWLWSRYRIGSGESSNQLPVADSNSVIHTIHHYHNAVKDIEISLRESREALAR